jgi:hypothetical protein
MGHGRAFHVRLGVLLVLLVGVLLWAWRDVRSRHERNAWQRPLAIAIVLVSRGRIDEAAVEAFRERVPALEDRLAAEYHRYRPEPLRPFALTLIGPVDGTDDPPQTEGDGLVDAAKESWGLYRWTSRLDRAAALDTDTYDSRIYVAARAPQRQDREMVEGESQQGGRLGAVAVELDVSMADFALFVVAHELFHTLGATDKYDGAGRTLIPTGLVLPDRVPLYPQPFADVMARNRPVAPGIEQPPERLDELAVGPVTAREVGWTL